MEALLTTHSRLTAVAEGMPLLADLHRGDVLLYEPLSAGRLRVVAQAQPHSVPPVHPRSLLGQEEAAAEVAALERVLAGRRAAQGARHIAGHRSRIVQRAYAVRDSRALVGILVIEKSLVEHERHATRRASFRRALDDLRDMVLRGEATDFRSLSPFKETDGVVVVDAKGIITYVSGLGSYHYRRLGYSEELVGKSITQQDTADASLIEQALRQQHALEDERYEAERLWIRKVIPIVGPHFRLSDRLPPSLSLRWPYGFGPRDQRMVLITLHDATMARRKAQEQAVRQAMVQEIHHRVKNNLQTVASLLRIQARRAQHEETRQALHEGINRILSIAVVHEFLSQHEKTINLRDVAQRIARQVHEGILDPARAITVRVEGDPVFLPAHQTTMVALIINELILNALEHGFGDAEAGEIVVSFTDEGDGVCLTVHDTGVGLPHDFNLREASSLGLRIVQTIVEQDLRGTFLLSPLENGTAAIVTFAKSLPETFD